jgi:inorganic phosphate transporter, PiT family
MMSANLMLVALPVLALAWVNGANDVAKGVSTLIGSGVSRPSRAIWWGTLWTMLGGLAAVLWGAKLASAFGGSYLASGFALSTDFIFGALVGAFAWVLLATRFGLPVSTTHALLGGIVGAALVIAGPAGLRAGEIANKALLPLALSPLLAIVVCWLLLLAGRWVGKRVPVWQPGCCPQENWRANPFVCARTLSPSERFAARLWTALHWLSGGATSFARGLNDVPKISAFFIVALAAGSAAVPATNAPLLAFVLVSVSMALGSIWGGLRVAEVLAHRVTRMDAAQGMTANLGTALLVLAASPLGLPVSTTHVSTGALFGIRWGTRQAPAEKDALRWILFAWLVTLPVAGIIAAAATKLYGILG